MFPTILDMKNSNKMPKEISKISRKIEQPILISLSSCNAAEIITKKQCKILNFWMSIWSSLLWRTVFSSFGGLQTQTPPYYYVLFTNPCQKRKLIDDFINQAGHSENTEKRFSVIKQSYDVSFVHFTKGYHWGLRDSRPYPCQRCMPTDWT